MRTSRVATLLLAAGLAGAVAAAAPATERRVAPRTATVVSAVAGGALDVRLAGGARERIRLIGIVAPRVGDCGAGRGIAETRRLAAGKRVTLVGDPAGAAGSSYVVLPGGRDLGRVLVASGYGQVDVRNQGFARFTAYVPAQRAAENGRHGIWGACAADVRVTLDGPDMAVVVGDLAQYTATVRNAGPLAARNVTLELRAPDGSALVAADSRAGACRARGWVVTCSFAAVPAGGQVTAAITLKTDKPGLVPVRAWASFLGCTDAHCGLRPLHDPDLVNDRTAALTTVLATPPAASSARGSASAAPYRDGCEPSYPTVCIPPPPPDLQCQEHPLPRLLGQLRAAGGRSARARRRRRRLRL